MDHSEAVEQMAAERYLLDELTPEAREAFEEHLSIARMLNRSSRRAVFVQEAKALLPDLASPLPAPVHPVSVVHDQAGVVALLLQPTFAAPVFATLLLVIGYQNLVTYPALRAAADQPWLLPSTALHGGMRGGVASAITADRRHGIALAIDLPPQPNPALMFPIPSISMTRKASSPGRA